MPRAHNCAVRILKKNKGETKSKNKEGDKWEKHGEEESKRMEENVIK